MREFHLRFSSAEMNEAVVDLRIEVQNQYVATTKFGSPLTAEDLESLSWYLEQYWRWPAPPDEERARFVEDHLRFWGHALFKAVLGNYLDQSFFPIRAQDVITIHAESHHILKLPWELMADSTGFLFQQGAYIRRSLPSLPGLPASYQLSLPLRILLVVARPTGTGFIDSRSIALPIIEAVEQLSERITIEFLRPPTFEQLAKRLQDKSLPAVQIVHFDGHGTYDSGSGQGYLAFENPTHHVDWVSGQSVGQLLGESPIPLVVLNACQSAKVEDAGLGSIATHLLQAKVGAVLAMSYVVLVEMAKQLMYHLYLGLVQHHSLDEALRQSRLYLQEHTERLTRYRPLHNSPVLHLQDWVIPTLYRQDATLQLSLPALDTSLSPGIGSSPLRRSPERGGFPPLPPHGFHGRNRELLMLERMLLHKCIVVISGFGGQGKTAFSTHAAEWFTRTDFFEQAVFISFEQGTNLEFILAELGYTLIGEAFTVHQDVSLALIMDVLDRQPTLIVWDNIESILANGAYALPPDELEALLELGAQLVSKGKSRLLLTTRDPYIDHPAYRSASGKAEYFTLDGLAPEDALYFAVHLLQKRQTPIPPRENLEPLLQFLGYHPLSIQLVIPHIQNTEDAAKLIAEFKSFVVSPKHTMDSDTRHTSLSISLAISLDRLPQELRGNLYKLALLRGGGLSHTVEDLLCPQEDSESSVQRARWQKVQQELRNAGLITIEQLEKGFTYIHLHPTLQQYLEHESNLEEIDSIKPKFAFIYHSLAAYLTFGRSAGNLRAIFVKEWPNFRYTLSLLFEENKGERVGTGDVLAYGRYLEPLLLSLGMWKERAWLDAQMKQFIAEKERSAQVAQPGDNASVALLKRSAMTASEGRFDEAESLLKQVLDNSVSMANDIDYPIRRLHAFQNLANLARRQGRYKTALAYYESATEAATQLSDENVRAVFPPIGGPTKEALLIGTYQQQGEMFLVLGQLTEAEKVYQRALQVAQSMWDPHLLVPSLTYELANIYLEMQDTIAAKSLCATALRDFQIRNEPEKVALCYLRLGRIAIAEQNWEAAQTYYRECLAINERLGNLPGMAVTYHHLSFVAYKCGRRTEAIQWLKQAIKLEETQDNFLQLAQTYANLASCLIENEQLEEAEFYAHRALSIEEKLPLVETTIYDTYNRLALIAHHRGHREEMFRWLRKELETFAKHPKTASRLTPFHHSVIEIVVRACRLYPQLSSDADKLIQQLGTHNNTERLGLTLRRLLKGERDIDVLAGELIGVDRLGAVVVYRILQMIGSESGG